MLFITRVAGASVICRLRPTSCCNAGHLSTTRDGSAELILTPVLMLLVNSARRPENIDSMYMQPGKSAENQWLANLPAASSLELIKLGGHQLGAGYSKAL